MKLLKLLIVFGAICFEELLVIVIRTHLLFLLCQDTVKNRIKRFCIYTRDKACQHNQKKEMFSHII